MLDSIKKMWRIPELRKKIVYTFLMLLLFRLVGVIPAPGIDVAKALASSSSNAATLPLLELANMMTGGKMSQMTLMAMGITPYINASIIMQLLTIAIPALERMSKDEEGDGKQKIQKITRYVTVGLALVQAYGIARGLDAIKPGWYNSVLVGVSMAGGTALAMWIGERITEKGVGNGVSLLIFAGIVCNLFNGVVALVKNALTSGTLSSWMNLVLILLLTVVMTAVVTFVEMGERRVPLQIAKQVKGRKVYGGQNTRMSLKVLSVGVLPLIFAYSFLAFPGTIIQLLDVKNGQPGQVYVWWMTHMGTGTVGYMIVSALLIIAFTYFYSSISFDPKQQAEQLRMQGATIPGTRSSNMAKYLGTTVNRLNLFAALFLAVLAAVPTLMTRSLNAAVPFAASSILIAVSVAIETIRTVQGELSVRGIASDMGDVGFM